MENEGENETSPLLGRDGHAPTGDATATEHLPWYQLRRPWYIGLFVILSATLWTFSVAIVRLHSYSGDGFDEVDLIRLNDVLYDVCRVLVAIPFGILADRARKPVYVLASAGQILSVVWMLLVAIMQPTIPRHLELLGALGQLLGGGILLVNVTHATILADVLPPQQRLLGFLALAFLQEPAIRLSVLLAEPLRRLYDPLPLVLSLALALLGASLVVFIPETARGSRPPQTEQVDEGWWSRSKACLHLRYRDVGPALAVAKSPNVLWVILALAAYFLATNGYWMMVFGWIWATHYFGIPYTVELSLLSFIIRCLTLGLLLPALAIMLVHPNGHARFTGYQRDLVLARISAIFGLAGLLFTFGPATASLVVGTIAVGLSVGLSALCQSLISYVAPASGYATIYSLVLALSTLVATAFAPLFYLEIQPPSSLWIFITVVVIVALLYLVILVALLQVKVRSAGSGNFVEPRPEEVQGDEGAALDNDEEQV